jgi:hypothetical protein
MADTVTQRAKIDELLAEAKAAAISLINASKALTPEEKE